MVRPGINTKIKIVKTDTIIQTAVIKTRSSHQLKTRDRFQNMSPQCNVESLHILDVTTISKLRLWYSGEMMIARCHPICNEIAIAKGKCRKTKEKSSSSLGVNLMNIFAKHKAVRESIVVN
jgi:hypothetical protein